MRRGVVRANSIGLKSAACPCACGQTYQAATGLWAPLSRGCAKLTACGLPNR